MFLYMRKIIALFEGCRSLPARPSAKNSIRIKVSMGSGGMILRGEKRSTLRYHCIKVISISHTHNYINLFIDLRW